MSRARIMYVVRRTSVCSMSQRRPSVCSDKTGQSWTWIGSIHGLDWDGFEWIGFGLTTVTPRPMTSILTDLLCILFK